MARKITFDIETTSAAPGKIDPMSMDLALVGIHDSETGSYDSFTVPELPRLWTILERADILIGYNSDHFDIPILNRYYAGDLTRIKSVDLLAEIRDSLGRRLKLDSVAEATLGKKKSGSGLESIKWWQEGDVERVRKYCLDDVKLTKEIYDFARKNGFVQYMDFKRKQKIPLDTAHWETLGDKNSMNHTLPF
ncbi:MAG: ribonuclease H-like domain-containing protein [Patescibacteria group bacterium]